MGVDVLDPVVREWPEWTYGDYVAGPAAANRTGCAAVAAAAASNQRSATGTTVFVISVQKSFGWAGLTAAIARLGRVESVSIVDRDLGRGHSTPIESDAPWPNLKALDVDAVEAIGVPTRFTGTLGETLREVDIETMHRSVARAAGVAGAPLPVQLTHGWTPTPPVMQTDSLSRYADLLSKLTEIYAVSGHEQPMRMAVQQALPLWARDSAVADSAGNLVLAMGPDRDTTVVIAHLDEIGFLVKHIDERGFIQLQTVGGFDPRVLPAQRVLVHGYAGYDGVVPAATDAVERALCSLRSALHVG